MTVIFFNVFPFLAILVALKLEPPETINTLISPKPALLRFEKKGFFSMIYFDMDIFLNRLELYFKRVYVVTINNFSFPA